MGLGIWAMHYIGMLAFTLPVPVLYHYPTVILSLFAAIAASAVALFTVSRERMGLGSSIVGSLIMGGGIASMHYIGMEAMRLSAMMEYRWNLIGLSIALAILISFVALTLAFRVRQETASLRKLLSAVVMGSAIPLMHYTGMWAVRFHISGIPFSTRLTVRISSLSIVVITLTSILAMVLAITSAFLDRILAVAHAARATERRAFASRRKRFRRLCGPRCPAEGSTIATSAGTNSPVSARNKPWSSVGRTPSIRMTCL